MNMIPGNEIQIGATLDVNLLQGTWRHMSIVLKLAPVGSDNNADDSRAKEVWEQELTILSKLRHPRIVSLLGCCQVELTSNDPLMTQPQEHVRAASVLEHMMKGNLRSLLDSEYATLTILEKVRLALDVSEGMRFLHDSDLYHRDLRSIYVLIDRDNRAKLTGFGGGDGEEEGWCEAPKSHSKSLGASQSHNKHVKTDKALNKLSPRTVEEKRQRKRTDIGAFGIIIWELITGKARPNISTATVVSRPKSNKHSKRHKHNTETTCSNSVLSLILSEEEIKEHPANLCNLMNQCLKVVMPAQQISSKKEEADMVLLCGFDEICDILEEIYLYETKKLKDQARVVPDGFLCPITQDVMRDPVMLIDGHSYERKAIVDWLKRSNRSPLTNEELPMMSKDATMPLMVDNYALKSAIANHFAGKIT
jgi:serine/threonine protein kinase